MKKISEHTDRELMEKLVAYSKVTSEGVSFIKNFVLITSIIGFVLALIAIF